MSSTHVCTMFLIERITIALLFLFFLASSLLFKNRPNISAAATASSSGWLTIVCRTYATTDVVRHTAYRRYDLFTTSVANLIGRTPGRTCATLRWPVSAATYSFFIFVSATF